VPDYFRETFHKTAKEASREADAFPYGPPPYVMNVSSSYAFFSLSSTGMDPPPDFMPDPNLIWQAGAPAYLYITRFSSSPWGPWDQVTFLKPTLIHPAISTLQRLLTRLTAFQGANLARKQGIRQQQGSPIVFLLFPNEIYPKIDGSLLTKKCGAHPLTTNGSPRLGLFSLICRSSWRGQATK
jgi:hypothetical protein